MTKIPPCESEKREEAIHGLIDDITGRLIETRADAASAGHQRYFTGMPCKHGHIAERRVSDAHCVVCSNVRSAIQFQRYPERTRKRSAAWMKKNPDRVKENRANRQRKNPEKSRSHSRKYRQNNLEKDRARCRDWSAKNRPLMAAHARNRRALKRNAVGFHTLDDVLEIKRLQGDRCAYCKLRLGNKGWHADHIIALVNGGSNDRSNIQVLCAPCNTSKGAKDPIQFAQSRGMLL